MKLGDLDIAHCTVKTGIHTRYDQYIRPVKTAHASQALLLGGLLSVGGLLLGGTAGWSAGWGFAG